ncbi:MAG: arsenic efflux protein [Clostridia bacterium]|nr:arsenic efflux protein [Clostridia bacterium]
MGVFFQSLGMALEDGAIDTLKAIPILFAVYIIVSFLEHNTHRYVGFFKKAKRFGPFVGASLGIVPQCGFSVAMADLYNKKYISIGTLIAVFIATSDEAIPILFSDYNFVLPMLLLIAIKFVYAIVCGYLIDLIASALHKKTENNITLETLPDTLPCECGHEGHDHEHTHHCCADNIFVYAIKHTLKIALFIFVVNVVINTIIITTNFDLNSLNQINKFVQPLITSVIGLIPNCIASVVLVEVYMAGGMTFGALLAGLATGAGVGLLVLFKQNKKALLNNILILGIVYTLGVLLGIASNLLKISL